MRTTDYLRFCCWPKSVKKIPVDICKYENTFEVITNM